VFCLAICAQHINAEEGTCKDQEDVLDKAELIGAILKNASTVEQWFSPQILAKLNDAIPRAPVSVVDELAELYNTTNVLKGELNDATSIASQSIELDLSTIEKFEDIVDVIDDNDKAFKSDSIVKSSCTLLDAAIQSAKNLTTNIQGCVQVLKSDILPNEEKIKNTLLDLSEMVVQAETHAFTPEQFEDFGNEIRNFTQSLDDILHIETKIVVKAGNKLKQCILQEVDSIQNGFEDLLSQFTDLFKVNGAEKTETPQAVEAPETPEAIEAPKTPEAVEAPKTPAAVEAPKTPAAVEAPKTPAAVEAPKTPAAVEAPKTPEVPEAPKTPAITA